MTIVPSSPAPRRVLLARVAVVVLAAAVVAAAVWAVTDGGASSSPDAGASSPSASPSPTAPDYTTDADLNHAATVASDALATRFGWITYWDGPPTGDPRFVAVEIVPTGLRVVLTAAPSADELARWQAVAGSVPVTSATAPYSHDQMVATTMQVVGLRFPGLDMASVGPDDSGVVQFVVRPDSTPDSLAALRAALVPWGDKVAVVVRDEPRPTAF